MHGTQTELVIYSAQGCTNVVAYMKHIVLYHWSLCACIVIGCVIRVYIGSCVATSESGYLILYFVRTYVTMLTMLAVKSVVFACPKCYTDDC